MDMPTLHITPMVYTPINKYILMRGKLYSWDIYSVEYNIDLYVQKHLMLIKNITLHCDFRTYDKIMKIFFMEVFQ